MRATAEGHGMRYRKLSVRYAMIAPAALAWPFGETWPVERVRPLAPACWRPDTDVYETTASLEVVVELAGVDDDDVEIQLFDDVLVIEGRRRPPAESGAARYHAAGIRHGPFHLHVVLPTPVDHDRVEARYERGLLRVTLPRRAGA